MDLAKLSIKAVVQTQPLWSKEHQCYYCITRAKKFGKVSISLTAEKKNGKVIRPAAWQDKEWPDPGIEVVLSNLVKKKRRKNGRGGWKAYVGRHVRLTDEESTFTIVK